MNNAYLVRARLFSRNKTLYGCEFGLREHKASHGSQFGAGITQQATNTLFVFANRPRASHHEPNTQKLLVRPQQTPTSVVHSSAQSFSERSEHPMVFRSAT